MASILVLNGQNAGEWHTLGHSMTFGRDASLLAEILDPCVSRRHLEVRYDDVQERHYAIDAGSRNGVIVNGEKLRGFCALEDGDGIQLGHTLLVFAKADFDDAEAAEARIEAEQRRYAALLADLAQRDRAYRERTLQPLHLA